MLVLAYLGCAAIWGTTWFAIRVCIAAYPPFVSAAIRFAIAAVILGGLSALGLAGRGPRPGRQRAWVAAAGLLCAVGYALVYAGETRISGGLAAVIYGTLPLVTAVVTLFVGTERPTRHALAGAAVALAGIGVIYWDRMHAAPQQAVGVAMVFASVCACTGYSLVLKRHAADLDPLATNAIFLVSAAAGMAALALVAERRLPPWPPPAVPTAALLYLAVVGSVACFALYFYLLKRMTLMALTTLVFIEPILAMLIDAGWEREIRLGSRTYLGAAITLAGVAVSLRPRGATAPRPVPQE
jgi:drug/metabolite transporter (DMT)-like permease